MYCVYWCILCALYLHVIEMWVIIVNYKRNYILLGEGRVVSYCSCLHMLGFVMCRLLSVQVVTVPMPIHYMCEYISRSAIFPVWLFFFKSFPKSAYVFGGRSPSTSPCRRRCLRFLDILLAQIRVGREAMWYVFVRPQGGPWSGSLSRLVG